MEQRVLVSSLTAVWPVGPRSAKQTAVNKEETRNLTDDFMSSRALQKKKKNFIISFFFFLFLLRALIQIPASNSCLFDSSRNRLRDKQLLEGKDSFDGTKNHVGSNKKEGKMSRHGGAIRILS